MKFGDNSREKNAWWTRVQGIVGLWKFEIVSFLAIDGCFWCPSNVSVTISHYYLWCGCNGLSCLLGSCLVMFGRLSTVSLYFMNGFCLAFFYVWPVLFSRCSCFVVVCFVRMNWRLYMAIVSLEWSSTAALSEFGKTPVRILIELFTLEQHFWICLPHWLSEYVVKRILLHWGLIVVWSDLYCFSIQGILKMAVRVARGLRCPPWLSCACLFGLTVLEQLLVVLCTDFSKAFEIVWLYFVLVFCGVEARS